MARISKATWGLVGLRSAATVALIAGDGKTAAYLHLLADAIQAGLMTDNAMRKVADRLKEGPITDADVEALRARIAKGSKELHEPPNPSPGA